MKKYSWFATAAAATSLLFTLPGTLVAHDSEYTDDMQHNRQLAHGGGSDGHIKDNVNFGYTLVGETSLGGVTEGLYTDVTAHKGFAYVGTFQNPECTRAGVFIADITNPSSPVPAGHIKSPPGTRINDVKTHEIGGKDYLFVTLEKCGPSVGGGNGGHQKGQGGISVYNITNPTKPHAVKQNMLDFQTHNTFPWTTATGSYLMVVDDENIDDVHIVDISKPQSPKLLSTTGIGTWLNDGQAPQVGDDGQIFTGGFAFSGLHDIWVEEVDGVMTAILSYWDAGFITLDVSDPANPVFMDDSTYPAVDPIHGSSPMEGNGHAAVFGNDADNYPIVFAGDEDFDAFSVGVVDAEGVFYGATTGSDTPLADVMGLTRYVGRGCNGDLMPAAIGASEIAFISRGSCSFTEKVANATAANYVAAVVMNDVERCEASVSMLVEGTIPAFFVPRPSGLAILNRTLDSGVCDDSTLVVGDSGDEVSVGSVFDGWGYMYVLSMLGGELEHVGYYAPAEVAEPSLATGAGDLTMHNLEIDPNQRDRAHVSWYALGLRAVDYRPGHLHNGTGVGIIAENMHETGRFIDERGSNIWGVTAYEQDGETYILASDRTLGLQIFSFTCEEKSDAADEFYCSNPNGL